MESFSLDIGAERFPLILGLNALHFHIKTIFQAMHHCLFVLIVRLNEVQINPKSSLWEKSHDRNACVYLCFFGISIHFAIKFEIKIVRTTISERINIREGSLYSVCRDGSSETTLGEGVRTHFTEWAKMNEITEWAVYMNIYIYIYVYVYIYMHT